MRCPHCGSDHVRSISNVHTYSDVKGYGCCKGLLGYICFGPIGWVCGLLGMGSGTTTTHTESLWVCDNCGTKFK